MAVFIQEHGFGLAAYTGVSVQLLAYFLLQSGFIRGTGYVYAGLNLVAAALILTGLLAYFNPSTAISQSFIFLISILGLTRAFLMTTAIRFTERERFLLDQKLPELPKISARRFLRAGRWVQGGKGDRLAREGERLGKLIFLASGSAAITVRGHRVGEVGAGDFVGEMSVLNGGDASASVTLNAPAAYFEISDAELARLFKTDRELGLHVERSITRDLCDKLLAANARAHRPAEEVAVA